MSIATSKLRVHFLVLGAAAVFIAASTPSTCQACRLFDWLFGRNRNVTTYYPTTAAANPSVNNGACCGPAQCEQTVLRYVPQVAYRTVWQPVPVTTYRRTVSQNPTTGLPMTCTQPCTTYRYQARRVPYTTFRPTYDTVSVTKPGTCNFGAAPAATTAWANPSSCACNGAAAPATGFGEPSTSLPYDSGVSATPWQRVDPAPATPQSGSQSSDPADRIPRIERDYGGSSVRKIPSVTRQDQGDTNGQGQRESNSTQQSGGYETNDQHYRQPSDWTRVNPSNQNGLGASRSNASSARSSFDSSTTPRSSTFQAKPLPNLDIPNNYGETNRRAPRLLNESTRDHTASLIRTIPTRWASKRIIWPAAYKSSSRPALSASRPQDKLSQNERSIDVNRTSDLESSHAASSGTNNARHDRRNIQQADVPTRRLDPRRVRRSSSRSTDERVDSSQPAFPEGGWRSRPGRSESARWEWSS